MSLADSLLPEFDHEMAGARRVLARVPAAEWRFRPHPKSMELGRLASHIAELVSWTMPTLTGTELDLAPPGGKRYVPAHYRTKRALLAAFDGHVKAARAAIAGTDDRAFELPWTLRAGGRTIFTMPRLVCLRSMILNHVIHHRAQLGVYLRLVGVPVPGLYGPSADES